MALLRTCRVEQCGIGGDLCKMSPTRGNSVNMSVGEASAVRCDKGKGVARRGKGTAT